MTSKNYSEEQILKELQRRRSNDKPDDIIEKTIRIKKKHWSAVQRLIRSLNTQ